MTLEIERLVIRNFKKCDSEYAFDLFSDVEAMRLVAMMPAHTSIRETEERVRRWGITDIRLAICLRESDEFIGYIAITPDEDEEGTYDLGFAIRKKYRKMGYTGETVYAVLSYLKEKGAKHVWACCFKENQASKALIESLGFSFINEGKYQARNDREYESLEYRIDF